MGVGSLESLGAQGVSGGQTSLLEGCGFNTVDDSNSALLLRGLKTMGVKVYSLLWVMQDFYHEPWFSGSEGQSSMGLASDWGFRVYTEVTAKYVPTCCVTFVGG